MGLATTGGAEVEGESQVKKSRRAIGTGGRLAGLRLRLRLRLAGWLLYSMFTGHARGSNSGRLACEATCVYSSGSQFESRCGRDLWACFPGGSWGHVR